METKIESKKQVREQEGFTLIEILVVIGMIALLAAIVIVAINPARQFAQGRNTQRTSNVNTILNAIGQGWRTTRVCSRLRRIQHARLTCQRHHQQRRLSASPAVWI